MSFVNSEPGASRTDKQAFSSAADAENYISGVNCFFLSALLLATFAAHAQSDATPSAIPRTSPLFSAPARSQHERSPLTALGVKLGGSLSTKSGERVPLAPRTGLLPGAVMGVYRILPLSRKPPLYLQPELLYSWQGHRLSNPSTQYKATLRQYYACLAVLLTAVYHRFFLHLGPQVGYLVGVNERFEHLPLPGSGATVGYNYRTDQYRRWEVAYVAGAGYRGQSGLGIEVRHIGGLTDLYVTSSGQHNAGWQLQASYPLIK